MVFSAEDRIFIKVSPANSLNLNPVDYRTVFWGNCRSASTITGFVTWISWSHTPDRRVGTIPAVGH